jgi:hypothetical protein
VPELKVRERATTDAKMSTADPREEPELEIRECPPST